MCKRKKKANSLKQKTTAYYMISISNIITQGQKFHFDFFFRKIMQQ